MLEPRFSCRNSCGACCIAPSISASIPGMPNGKPAGDTCLHLLPDLRCALFGKGERPAVCNGFQASAETCGTSREDALSILSHLEEITRPGV